jgi:hypothetical protein
MSRSEFDRSSLPSWMSPDLKEIVGVASVVGWKVHVSSDSVGIHSPVREDKRWVFTAGRRSTYPLNRIRREVARWCDPKIARIVIEGDAAIKDPALRKMLVDALPTIEDATVDHTAEEEQARIEKEQRRSKGPDPIEQRDLRPSAHIVSEKAMLAKGKSHDAAYQSETTIERRWSDGTVDYKCTECDYTSPNRLSPSKHYANTHSVGQAPKPPQFKADVPDAAVYRPRRKRVEALSAMLRGLMDAGWTDPDVLAEKALQWVHEQSRQGTEHAAETEDLTPEDILNRIRLLLDDGGMAQVQQAVASLEQQVVDLESRLTAEREAREKAERERDDVEDTLQALHELTASAKQKAG